MKGGERGLCESGRDRERYVAAIAGTRTGAPGAIGKRGCDGFRLDGPGETRVVGNTGRRDAGSAAPAGQCGAPGSCASVPGTARPVRSGARDCASRGLGEEKPTGSQSRAGLPVVGISMRDRRRPAFGFRRRLRVGSTNAGRTARR